MDKFIKSYSSFREQQIPRKKPRLLDLFKKPKRNTLKPITSRLITPDSGLRPRPLYSRPKPEKNWRKIILLTTLLTCIACWVGLMLYLPFFQINRISISGLKTINYEELHSYINDKYLKRSVIPTNNYFLVRPGKIADDISNKYAVEKVEVFKNFPGSLVIKVTEKITSIILDTGYSYVLLDSEGTAVKIISVYNEIPSFPGTSTQSAASSSSPFSAPATASTSASSTAIVRHAPDYLKLRAEYDGLPIFYDQNSVSVSEKQTAVLPPQTIKFFIAWQSLMRSEGIGEVRYFESSNLTAGASVYSERSWSIKVQPRNPVNQQMTNLKVILSNREVKPVEYIDLRFGERVFWK